MERINPSKYQGIRVVKDYPVPEALLPPPQPMPVVPPKESLVVYHLRPDGSLAHTPAPNNVPVVMRLIGERRLRAQPQPPRDAPPRRAAKAIRPWRSGVSPAPAALCRKGDVVATATRRAKSTFVDFAYKPA
jgi:hypothetical protein